MTPKGGSANAKNRNGGKRPQKSLGNAAEDHETEYTLSRDVPTSLQQVLLNVFRDTFPVTIQADLSPTLQRVKGHLYNRDFAKAFGSKDHREAYALRWSPSRALCYARVFNGIFTFIEEQVVLDKLRILCLGGGAGAELVGLAGALHCTHAAIGQRQAAVTPEDDSPRAPRPAIHAVDVADWSSTIHDLYLGVTTPPQLSPYASAAAKLANSAVVDERNLSAEFTQTDLLSARREQIQQILKNVNLVTIMFTMNELYSASLPRAQALLQMLTDMSPAGTYLLVVDSPGSYSTVTLNGKDKKYPMHWLMDYTLLAEQEAAYDKSSVNLKWDKLRTEPSTWFRVAEELRYPVQLENMRYQLHLYRHT